MTEMSYSPPVKSSRFPFRKWFKKAQVPLTLGTVALLMVAILAGWYWLAGLVTLLSILLTIELFWDSLREIFQVVHPEESSFFPGQSPAPQTPGPLGTDHSRPKSVAPAVDPV